MLGHLYQGQDCSAARALEIVGERWSLLILRDAIFRRYTRFSDFQRSLGIASNILARRLEGFVMHGLMEVEAGEGGRSEYRLTRKGRDLAPVIITLTQWGDAWLGLGPVEFGHPDCAGLVEARLVCAGSGAAVSVDGVAAIRRAAAGD